MRSNIIIQILEMAVLKRMNILSIVTENLSMYSAYFATNK